MGTFLFDSVIFGPIHSRRLGVSLGVNLVHPNSKLCNFDCIYCECGWNSGGRGGAGFNTVGEVVGGLEAWILGNCGTKLDYITFAGNGEPTMHPDFAEIIQRVVELRNRLVPGAKIAVLSNATMLDRPGVLDALALVDRPILKLDSGTESTYELLNQPQIRRGTQEVIDLLSTASERLEGKMVIQTMFLRNSDKTIDRESIDNTTPQEIIAWIDALRTIRPHEVMIYSLDRDTPQSGLQKVSTQELREIAQKVEQTLGITTHYPSN